MFELCKLKQPAVPMQEKDLESAAIASAMNAVAH